MEEQALPGLHGVRRCGMKRPAREAVALVEQRRVTLRTAVLQQTEAKEGLGAGLQHCHAQVDTMRDDPFPGAKAGDDLAARIDDLRIAVIVALLHG